MTQETEIKERLEIAKAELVKLSESATKGIATMVLDSLDDIPILLKVIEELRGENKAMRAVVGAAGAVNFTQLKHDMRSLGGLALLFRHLDVLDQALADLPKGGE